jgi:hypothetical protein
MDPHGKEVMDGILGVGAVSSPIWLQYLQTTVGMFMLIGGALLLALRLAIAWREWRAGKSGR